MAREITTGARDWRELIGWEPFKTVMTSQLSPAQVARAIGVSESSVKRWCDRDLIDTLRTEGGHRRITPAAAIAFARSRGYTIADPELLGLPVELGTIPSDAPDELLLSLLLAGDGEGARALLLQLYLDGQSLRSICDAVLAPALRIIGEGWHEGRVEVFEERRAVMIVLAALRELRDVLPRAERDAPLAIGASLSGDVYDVPTQMVEAALREVGWRATSLGSNIPMASLLQAIAQLRPRLFWISVSHVRDEQHLIEDVDALFAACSEVGAALVLGGRALDDRLRRQLRYTSHADTLGHLVAFSAALGSSAR